MEDEVGRAYPLDDAEEANNCGISLAPIDFHEMSLFDEDLTEIHCNFQSQSSISMERCQLCRLAHRYFYCARCVRQGLFLHSEEIHSSSGSSFCDADEKGNGEVSNKCKTGNEMGNNEAKNGEARENFAEKLLRLKGLTRERSLFSKMIFHKTRRPSHVRWLNSRIQCTRDNISLLTGALETSRAALVDETKCLEKLREETARHERSMTDFLRKKVKITDYLGKRQPLLSVGAEEVSKCDERLAEVRRKRVYELTSEIFSIREIKPKGPPPEDPSGMSTVSLLADACHTAYIKGQWVYTDSSSWESAYCIIAPSLPASGDYSAFSAVQIESRESVPHAEAEPIHRNPSSTIMAGLSLTSQLVSLLEYYLDTTTPLGHRYVEFSGGPTLSDTEFWNSVFRLNRNVLFLCFAQNVNLNYLHPRQTLHNVLQLVNLPTLGSNCVAEGDSSLMQSMEASLKTPNVSLLDLSFTDDYPYFGMGGDRDLALEKDWEDVPSSLPEAEMTPMRPISASYFASGLSSTITSVAGSGLEGVNNASSMVSSAMSSVVSMWPWRWGGSGGSRADSNK